MIVHTVCFTLRDETRESAFLDAARATLPVIPGVSDFGIARQVGTQSDFRLQFSMTFPDQAAYTAYNEHPAHQEFVATRWAAEVAAFQEFDFVPVG